ncbi:prostatic acid phosphatase-like [Pecten maximus]|uniref:prostatic acid phosphatase-like n=1 Tax=Pecten maximus TaxID=6579 RepID=UPI001457FEC5|nr:prostatic acid phosphatase-like [Pecten maximus]XP_033761357.1 prostatic acid phosphatase-like [Pecten maximus]
MEKTKVSILSSSPFLILLKLLVLQIQNVKGDHLVLVQAVFRHGDRSPVNFYPNDRHRDYWPQGLGQLTKIGMNQEYRLGKFFRERYIQRNDTFLSSRYEHSEVYIRSTDKDRTLMSAYCVLSGMFPPLNGSDEQWNTEINWQPIPVHTIPLDEDFLLNTQAPCPRFNELEADFFKSEFVANFTSRYQDLINNASKLSGLPPTLVGLMIIVDTLFCEYTHHLNMSEWETVLPLHPLVIQLLDYENTYLFYTEEMAKLRGGPLLKEMIEKMATAVDSLDQTSPVQTRPKMLLYSAHDSTLTALLRVMNVFNNRTPVYSSCVMVEMWRPEGKGKPYVKVLYRNETDSDKLIHLTVPGCGDICSLDDFINILKNNVSKDIHAECNPKPGQQPASDIDIGMVVLGCMVALLTLTVIALIVLHYKNRQTTLSYRPLATVDDDYT